MTSDTQLPSWFQYPRFNWKNKHAVVIGAGIAGCQISWHLVQQGWHVTLIEREKKVSQHASGNPAGIISPKMTAQSSNGEDFYVSCFDYAIRQLNKLKNKHKSLDWHACGLLQLAHNAREEKRWESLKDRNFDQRFLQLIDQHQSSNVAGIPIDYKASYFPQAGWVNPVNFCETLLSDCVTNYSDNLTENLTENLAHSSTGNLANNVTNNTFNNTLNNSSSLNIILETDVINLENKHESWNLLNQENQLIASAEVVIITSGKDINQFTQSSKLPTIPVAGQTTSATPDTFSKKLKTTIGHEGYLTPVSDITSQLTFGASFDRNFNRNVDKPVLDTKTDKSNLQQLRKYLPQLADSFVETNSAHAAIRMTTPDRFPYLGGIADSDFYTKTYSDLHQGKHYKEYPNAEYMDGLFVLGGFGSRGLTTSGLCAKVLSDILNNDSDTENHSIQQYCHPGRFIIKNLKRNKA